MTRSLTRHIVGATAAMLLSGLGTTAAGQHGDAPQLLSKLSASRHMLVEGILQAEKRDGPVISAKFEMKGDQLMLSVYTAKNRAAIRTRSTIRSWAHWTRHRRHLDARSGVFADTAHVACSAMQLTLMQLTRLSLVGVIKQAEAEQPGTVYSPSPLFKTGSRS